MLKTLQTVLDGHVGWILSAKYSVYNESRIVRPINSVPYLVPSDASKVDEYVIKNTPVINIIEPAQNG